MAQDDQFLIGERGPELNQPARPVKLWFIHCKWIEMPKLVTSNGGPPPVPVIQEQNRIIADEPVIYYAMAVQNVQSFQITHSEPVSQEAYEKLIKIGILQPLPEDKKQ